jgi:hypothetical protein
VRARPAEVGQQFCLVTASLLQSIGQHGEPCNIKGAGGQFTLVVGGLSQSDRLGCPPGGGGRDRAEGAEEVAE